MCWYQALLYCWSHVFALCILRFVFLCFEVCVFVSFCVLYVYVVCAVSALVRFYFVQVACCSRTNCRTVCCLFFAHCMSECLLFVVHRLCVRLFAVFVLFLVYYGICTCAEPIATSPPQLLLCRTIINRVFAMYQLWSGMTWAGRRTLQFKTNPTHQK